MSLDVAGLRTAGLAPKRRDVGGLMREVMLALVPGTLAYAVLIDARVLANVLVAMLAALACEALALALRGRPPRIGLGDGSALLAGWLLALAVTPLLPAWQLVFGTAIALLIGKHAFGGLGHNVFNPAMVGYAVLLVSFPATMTAWPEPSRIDVAPVSSWDTVTAATPLDRLDTLRRRADEDPTAAGGTVDSTVPAIDALASGSLVSDVLVPDVPASDVPASNAPMFDPLVFDSPWARVNLAWLLGGLYLLARRAIAWHIPVAVLASLAGCHALRALATDAPTLGPGAALFAGAAMLGAFFIATDPVSAAASPRGRLIYGAGIGSLTFAMREFSTWPEGIAFAVLAMNAAVPLIDRLCVPAGRHPFDRRPTS